MNDIKTLDWTASTVFVIGEETASIPELDELFSSVHIQAEYIPTLDDGFSRLDEAQKGCIIVNGTKPDIDGAEVIYRLRDQRIEMPVVLLSKRGDVATAVTAIKSGCSDVLEMPVSGQDLLDSIYEAMLAYMAHDQHKQWKRDLWAQLETLTPREWDVLIPMIKGRSNPQIGKELNLSHRTIEVYRARIMQKTKASNLPELIRLSIQLNLFSQSPRPRPS